MKLLLFLPLALLIGCASNQTTHPLNLTGVNAWGDSLTQGDEGTQDQGFYPADLGTLLPQLSFVSNFGVGGQTSTQIGVRVGAIPTEATVSGGSIPASGSVPVSFPAGYEPVTVQGPKDGVIGTILGIRGTVTYTADGLVFTRENSGDAVSAPDPTPFTVDNPYIGGFTDVFWECHNNASDPEQCKADLQKQISFIKGDSYLVLGVINLNTPSEWRGHSGYDTITALNASLSAIYGDRYLDIRKVLVDKYNPALTTDVSDYNHDEPPTSLRAQYGLGVLANALSASDATMALSLKSGGILKPGEIATIETGANAENVLVSSVSGSTAIIVRNYGGAQVAHPAGAAVQLSDSIHLNAQGYQAVAGAVAQWITAHRTSDTQ